MAHLEHRLPWGTIVDLFLNYRQPPEPDSQYAPLYEHFISQAEQKKLRHFARCLISAIRDFGTTDKSSEDERAFYDPKSWGNEWAFGVGAHAGCYCSVMYGYLELNLILSDPERCVPQLIRGKRYSYGISLMLGECDGHQPDAMAQLLRPAFQQDLQPESMTREVMKVLRDHAARMFRCMYSVSGENHLLKEEVVYRYLCSKLRVRRDLTDEDYCSLANVNDVSVLD